MWKSERLTAFEGMEVACWDLDSTVRSTMQRRWLVPEIWAGRATWDDYSLACGEDTPIEGTVALMRVMDGFGVLNFAVSACADSALGITETWAKQHDVPIDDYLLRPAGDRMPGEEWKVSCVKRLQAAGLKIRFFAEDWAPAATYIREHTGVPVLGINPFDPGVVMVGPVELGAALDHRIGAEGLAAEPGTGPELAGDVLAYLEGKLCL